MPTIRERITTALLGPERARLQRTTQLLYDAYLEGPYQRTPDELLTSLREVDSAVLQDLVNQLYYEQIGTLGYSAVASDEERMRAVREARRAFKYDPVTDFGIWCWTNYGFGTTLDISLRSADEDAPAGEETDAQKFWSEFWHAKRNAAVLSDRNLHHLSNKVLTDGELFLAFFVSTLDGKATVRRIATDEISEIVTHPDDASQVLYYKRTYKQGATSRTVYYLDWLAGVKFDDTAGASGWEDPNSYIDATGQEKPLLPSGAVVAHNDVTFVCILHVAHNQKDDSPRGWPIALASQPWARAHKKFREDRASVAAAVAMFVNKIRADTGSRGLDAIRSRLQSALTSSNLTETNPPAPAGSTAIYNKQMDLERMPLTTGAGDAKHDGDALLQMAGLGMHLYPHYLGSGDAYRLATATAMAEPLRRNFARYQLFWTSVWEDVVSLVIMMASRYGNQQFDEYIADISTEQLLQTDTAALMTSVAALYRDVIASLVSNGVLSKPDLAQISGQIMRIVLQALGVDNVTPLIANLVNPPEELSKPKVEPPAAAPVPTEPEGNAPRMRGDDEEVPASEAIDAATGAFTPKGQLPAAFEGDEVPITAEDVERAIKVWNLTMPPDLFDLLRAVPVVDAPRPTQDMGTPKEG